MRKGVLYLPGRKSLHDKKKIKLNVMVEPATRDQLVVLSEKMNRSVSSIINESICNAIDKFCDEGVYSIVVETKKEREGMLQSDGKDHKGIAILIANNKGGVSKTTTTAALAVLAGYDNKKVLVVDLDGQANVSGLFGYEKDQDEKNIGNYFADCISKIKKNSIDFESIESFVQPTDFKNVDILVGSGTTDNLSHSFAEVGSILGSKTIIGLMLNKIRALNIYDYIIFDSSPSNNDIIQSAIRACDWTITPSHANHDSMVAVSAVLKTIKTQKELENKVSEHAGVLFTKVDSRTSIGRSLPEFKNSFENGEVHTFKTFIPISSAVEKSEFMRAPVVAQYPNDKVSKKYKDFYRELVSLIEQEH